MFCDRLEGGRERKAYEAGVLEAGDDLWREASCDVGVGCSGGGFVTQRWVVGVFHDVVVLVVCPVSCLLLLLLLLLLLVYSKVTEEGRNN